MSRVFYCNEQYEDYVLYGFNLASIENVSIKFIEKAEVTNSSVYLMPVWQFSDIDANVSSDVLTKISTLNDAHVYTRQDFYLTDVNQIASNVLKLVRKYNIKPQNIWIRTGYEFQKQELDEALQQMNITQVNTISFNTYLHHTYVRMHDVEYTEVDSNSAKRFSTFSRRYDDWRFEFFCGLIDKRLLDNFNYTFTNCAPEQIPVYPHISKSKEELKASDIVAECHRKGDLYFWIDNLPYTVNHDNMTDPYPNELNDLYKSSHINIVLETLPVHSHQPGSSIMITEKTFKAIAMGKPFILYSPAGIIDLLKKLGFKTFDPFLDESYNNDSPTKADAILNEIKRLDSMSDTEFHLLTSKLQKTAKFNLNKFKRLGAENATKLNLLKNVLW